MAIDVVVVNYKTDDLLDAFIRSYFMYPAMRNSTLTVIDVETNAKEKYQTDTYRYVAVEDNCGYARACNLGASLGYSEYVALFNADTRFDNISCLDRCIEFMDQTPNAAIVGPLQYSSDGRVTHGGFFGTHAKPVEFGFGKPLKEPLLFEDRQAVTVSGSAFFVRRAVWDELAECSTYLGFLDREGIADRGAFLPTQHFYEETACAYHAAAHGYEVWYLGSAQMVHEWHKSSPVGSRSKDLSESRALFNSFCDYHVIERP